MAQSPGREASIVGGRLRFRAVLLAATLFLATFWARPAAAATVYVDCSGGTPGALTSIGAAVNSLTAPPPTNDWHYILLKSNCTENVLITGGRKLWIAPDGSQCPYAACLPMGPALRITAANQRRSSHPAAPDPSADVTGGRPRSRTIPEPRRELGERSGAGVTEEVARSLL